MLDFKRHIFCPAVGTLPSPFLEQVLTDFVSGKRALLVLPPADFRVLHLLHVELDQLHAACADGTQSRQAPYPGQHVTQSADLRGWKPALSFISAIAKTRLAIACFALTPPASYGSPCCECLSNLVSAMGKFGGKNDLA